MKHNDNGDQDNSDDVSEDTRVSITSSNIEEDNFDYQQTIPHPGYERWVMASWTTRVLLPKIWSPADTVIAHPPRPNSRIPPVAMAPPLLKL